ncbi:MAG: peptidase S16 [SAR86 cluster bacterium]|uniref:Peptidase S16 n=1 Tax=SAR86 cluster bacterium TaxID=2030880 RepID=A0A2A5B193_9GAMM|nr:MAG: peptidase S16 [SAR86 cluster bacterium]
MNDSQDIPLFPLHLVMFPGGRLDLQIFERRYIDLVRSCLRSETGFGICLLKEGEEVIKDNSRQKIYNAGTYAHIVDWDQLENGLLGITVEGSTKFVIEDCWQIDDGLLMSKVKFSETDSVGKPVISVEDEFEGLADLLQSLGNHPLVEQKKLKIDYDNLWDLGWRLGELIPVTNEKKQHLLELDDPWERIEQIEKLVADLTHT